MAINPSRVDIFPCKLAAGSQLKSICPHPSLMVSILVQYFETLLFTQPNYLTLEPNQKGTLLLILTSKITD